VTPRAPHPSTLAPGRRLFIAVPLPESTKAAVAEIVDHVRAQALPIGMRDVRWVRVDGLHLTLRFLGPTLEDREPPTIAAMERAAAASAAGEGSLAGSGAFPRHGRPRTLWVGVSEGADHLAGIAETLGGALAEAGWPRDDRPFRAHLTLARSDGLASGPLVAARLAEAIGDRTIPFQVDRLVLFESVTGGGPARYVPMHEATLAGKR
jgi:2'-5' RNA ligase